VRAAGIPLDRLALRSLRSVERDVHLVADPARLALSVPQAALLLGRRRPDAIFTTGGYVAIPVLLAARALRIPVLLWEGNVIPGRSVRATARLAAAIAVSFAATCAVLGGRRPCLETGTPIRDTSVADRLAARTRMGIPADARVLLVFGGSQAVRTFNEAVAGALPELVARPVLHVIHVTGDDAYAPALTAREALPSEVRSRYRPEPFLREGMLEALAAADMVVGRAGSSTLAEVTALGLPMVVVPYPHAAGHQRANALRLVEAGAARLVEDEAFDAGALLDAADLLQDPPALAAMAAAAAALGRPAAADAVAAILLALAGRRALPDAATVQRIAKGGLP
jgi:UDP-N-acetylglucosamine--N-acetylmuramyl-(pentapeptide) pyrophosphoryl-undecaprenol N-acetylglucosamine transferase